MRHVSENTGLQGFPTGSNTNWPVQSEKKRKSLKVWIRVDVELYYSRSENKNADQMCSYCTAYLHLCFRICKNPIVSSTARSA